MMRLNLCMLAVAAILIATTLPGTAGSPAGEYNSVDPTTGQQYVRNVHPELEPYIVNSWKGKTILWDTSHGVLGKYRPQERYSGWKALMEGKGNRVIEDDRGITAHELDCDVLVINVASAWFTPYTLKETNIITDFVSGGGSLLILGDHAGTPNDHINLISLAFGTNLGLSYIQPYFLSFSKFAEHDVFQAVGEISFIAAGEIRANHPSQALAWTDRGETVIAGAKYGLGRVFVTGDVNFMDNFYIANADNQIFTEYLFEWLLERPSILPQASDSYNR